MRIIACLRRLLAYDRVYDSLGSAVGTFIEKNIIVSLRRMASRVENPERQSVIMDLADAYQPYANPRTPQGRDLVKSAVKVIYPQVRKYFETGLGEEDVVQEIAQDFIKPNSGVSRALRRFDPLDGPVKFRNYMIKILSVHVRSTIRDLMRKYVQEQQRHTDPDERDPYGDVAAPADRQSVKDFLDDMGRYVAKNADRFARNPADAENVIELFDLWSKLAARGGGQYEDVDTGKVIPKWRQMRRLKGKTDGVPTFREAWNAMKKTIADFVRKEGVYAVAAGENMTERVARSGFRMKLSKWILGE